MKLIFTILICTVLINIGKSQVDTITLNLEQLTAPSGEESCLSLKAENFNNIVSIQLGFTWDASKASLDTILSGRLKNISFSKELGSALFLWLDVFGITTTSEESLIELCFTSSSNSPTPITITSTSNLRIEATNTSDQSLYVQTAEKLFSPQEKPQNCEEDVPCISGLEINYEEVAIEIWPQDLMTNLAEEFIRCNNTSLDLLKLINLSSAETTPSDYIELSCGNLRDTSYIALAIQNFDSPQYWVSCIVPIYIKNISESNNCINKVIYPSDPRICNDIIQDADGNSLNLGHEKFLNLSSPPTVEHTYFNHTYGWEYSQVGDENSILLNCGDFNQSLSLVTSMIIAPPEGPPGTPQIIIPEFCSHQIEITADSIDCNSSIAEGQAKLKINGLPEQRKLKAYINSNELERLSDDSYVIELGSLLAESNELSLETLETPLETEVSTLDVIYMIRALRDEEVLSSHQIIAADIDRSGSITTKDILLLRRFILGIISTLDGGFLYLADVESNTPNLDLLSFDNEYRTFSFDKKDIDTDLELFAGVIGNVNLNKRNKNKNLKDLELVYEDQYLTKGEQKSIIVEIKNPSNSYITGLLLSLSKQDLEINNITVPNNNSAIFSNISKSEYRFSYIDLDFQKEFKLQLEITSKKNGFLSDLLFLSDYRNEGINSNDQEYQLVLTPQFRAIESFQAYPNPTEGALFLDIPMDYQGGTVSISNVLGTTIWQENISVSGLKVIDSDILSRKGLYIVQLQKESHGQTLKVYVN